MTPSRRRQANPNLGAYFGIVASAFVSLVVGLAIFEQLGWQQTSLAQAMILVPLVLYLGIAFGARTLNVEDFFVSGRRVPPVYNGAVLSAVLIGGTGFFGYTGTLFFLGFDALAIGLAWTTGLLVSGLLFVPYLRKSGAYTLPGFFGHRFRSRSIRALASVLLDSASGALARSRDQDRGPDRSDVPAALLHACRLRGGHHDRRHHHRRRHALAHLERER